MAFQFTQTGAEIQDILDQVGPNTQDIGTLNTFMGSFSSSPTTPSAYNSGATNINDGYIRIGKLVFVSV